MKLVCACLGVDTSGEVDLKEEDLVNRSCYVSVDIEEYENDNGQTKSRNSVPFVAYEPVGSSEGQSSGDDLPI